MFGPSGLSGVSGLSGYAFGGGAYGQQSNMSWGTTLSTATITVGGGGSWFVTETKVTSPPSLDSDGVLAYLRARKAEWLDGVKVK